VIRASFLGIWTGQLHQVDLIDTTPYKRTCIAIWCAWEGETGCNCVCLCVCVYTHVHLYMYMCINCRSIFSVINSKIYSHTGKKPLCSLSYSFSLFLCILLSFFSLSLIHTKSLPLSYTQNLSLFQSLSPSPLPLSLSLLPSFASTLTPALALARAHSHTFALKWSRQYQRKEDQVAGDFHLACPAPADIFEYECKYYIYVNINFTCIFTYTYIKRLENNLHAQHLQIHAHCVNKLLWVCECVPLWVLAHVLTRHAPVHKTSTRMCAPMYLGVELHSRAYILHQNSSVLHLAILDSGSPEAQQRRTAKMAGRHGRYGPNTMRTIGDKRRARGSLQVHRPKQQKESAHGNWL